MSAETRPRGCPLPGWIWPLLLAWPAPSAAGPAEPAPAPELLEFLVLWDAGDEDWFDAELEQADGDPARRDAPADPDDEIEEASDDDAS